MRSSNQIWFWGIQRINRTAPIPEAVRREVMQRCQRLCENCGDRTRLELHHTSYRTYDHEPIFGKETANDLEALCRDCHRGRHTAPDGEFWADPEEMQAEWYWYAED